MDIVIRKRNFKVIVGQNKEAWKFINTGLWEQHSFDILDYFVKNKAIILDIGCWSGVISLYIANKASKVYALDPDPICFKELLKNIELNPKVAKKIIPFDFAISDKKELVQLSARKKYGQSSSSILPRRRDKEFTQQINTISLLDFIKKEKIEKVDFIKMDVEGAEFKILPTIGKALQKVNYPTLYVSFHYNFLNENMYHIKIKSSVLNKIILKIETIFGISFFKKSIQKINKNLFNDLFVYRYIYTAKGNLVSADFLKNNLYFIKNNDLVFTNTKWHK